MMKLVRNAKTKQNMNQKRSDLNVSLQKNRLSWRCREDLSVAVHMQ
jgi:hypothetical protein